MSKSNRMPPIPPRMPPNAVKAIDAGVRAATQRPEQQAPEPVQFTGSDAAPVIYFDAISCWGLHNGVVALELVAQHLIPTQGPAPKSRMVCCAHLRCGPGQFMEYFKFLRTIAQSIEEQMLAQAQLPGEQPAADAEVIPPAAPDGPQTH